MLKKLFNSDKKYYLELDEIKDSEVVQSAVKKAEKAADVVRDQASEIANSQPVRNAVETATETAEAAQDQLASVVATDEKPGDAKAKSKANTEVKVNGKVKQDGKAKRKTAAQSQNKKTQPSIKNSGASSYEPPFWVAAMYNNSSSNANGSGQAAKQTFAPDNLMPTVSKYRRRPGGSLAKFKDMAKQAKTPRG